MPLLIPHFFIQVDCSPGEPANTKTYDTPNPNVTYNTQGADFGPFIIDTTCSATLTLTDSIGRTSTATTFVNFPARPMPIAEANHNYTLSDAAGGLTLDSTGSYEEAGTIISYAWVITCQPDNQPLSFLDLDHALTYGTKGSDLGYSYEERQCTIELTVTDDLGRTADDESTVTIPPAPIPVAVPGGPYTAGSGRSPVIDGASSSDPALVGLATYEWMVSCVEWLHLTHTPFVAYN